MYVDTSAYLCMLLGEDGSKRLSAEIDGSELLSSVLLVLEAKRNLTDKIDRFVTIDLSQQQAARELGLPV